MDTTLLEEFVEDLKYIEEYNRNNPGVPNLMANQIFVINDIIKMAEQKISENK